MASDTVQQIKDRLSIVDVVSGYVKLERSGASLRARCPFHAEKSPSFFVSPERGTYHCFGCNVGGDIFSFVEAIEGLDFKGALKVLAERAGVKVSYQYGERGARDEYGRLFEVMEAAARFYEARLDEAAKRYLDERGIGKETVRVFRLGLSSNGWDDLTEHLLTKQYTEKEILDAGLGKKNERGGLIDKFRNRIIFPINDSAGRVVAFSGRTFGPHASPEAPKYLNSPETPLFHKSRILYGFDKAKLTMRSLNCAVLVEGQIDLLASHQAGWGNTVAVSGTAFTSEHASLIKRMTENLVIALDADSPGIKAAARAARAALSSGLNVKIAQLPAGLDPADLILKDGGGAWRDAIRNATDIITFLLDVCEQRAKDPDAFRRSVEMAVLPFLLDIRSVIAREQHIRQIAGRLGVSESAVASTLDNIRRTNEPGTYENVPTARQQQPVEVPDRMRHALSLLLWQKSLAKPSIDVAWFERECAASTGGTFTDRLRALDEVERERLRFEGEHTYGNSTAVALEASTIIRLLLEEKISRELADATSLLKHAEESEDETEIGLRTADVGMLTTQLAKLRITG